VRPLGARFAGLVAPSPDKEEGSGHFHPSGAPPPGIDAALKKNIVDWLIMPHFGGRMRPATEVAPDIAKSAFADSPRGSTGMACFSCSVVARRAVVTAVGSSTARGT